MIHELDRLWIGAAIVWCAAVTTGPAQGAVQRTGDGIPSDITGLYRCEGPGASGVCVVRQRGDASSFVGGPVSTPPACFARALAYGMAPRSR